MVASIIDTGLKKGVLWLISEFVQWANWNYCIQKGFVVGEKNRQCGDFALSFALDDYSDLEVTVAFRLWMFLYVS